MPTEVNTIRAFLAQGTLKPSDGQITHFGRTENPPPGESIESFAQRKAGETADRILAVGDNPEYGGNGNQVLDQHEAPGLFTALQERHEALEDSEAQVLFSQHLDGQITQEELTDVVGLASSYFTEDSFDNEGVLLPDDKRAMLFNWRMSGEATLEAPDGVWQLAAEGVL
ncbi:MAG: hypothetical protein SFZ03_04485 [Candidatus Melainabacteria bacterium]|nr:hypothetical protein [Candidatus Melainabacteria bacterium]